MATNRSTVPDDHGAGPASESNDAVLTEVHDRVLVIRLNRPKVHNVIDQALTDGVLAALRALSRRTATSERDC